MKIISSLDEAIDYANKLGLSGVPEKQKMYPGWIPFAQENLCRAVDQMLLASGQGLYRFKPFTVKYNRKEKTFTASIISS